MPEQPGSQREQQEGDDRHDIDDDPICGVLQFDHPEEPEDLTGKHPKDHRDRTRRQQPRAVEQQKLPSFQGTGERTRDQETSNTSLPTARRSASAAKASPAWSSGYRADTKGRSVPSAIQFKIASKLARFTAGSRSANSPQ